MRIGRRYHFNSAGLVYLVTTAVLVLGAINGQNNLLFLCFGLAVAGLVVSGLVSGAALMGIRVEREHPAPGGVDGVFVVRYRITNRNRWFGAFGLTITELPSARLGRFRGTWERLMPAPAGYVAYVPPRSSVVVEGACRPGRRGIAVLGPYAASSVFPFGLVRKSMVFHAPAQVLIRPRPAEVRARVFDGRNGRGEAAGIRASRSGGDEFFSLREYAAGDASRLIAWRSTARLGRVVVRELAERAARRVWVVVSPGPNESMAEQAVAAAAGVALTGLDAGFEVGLMGEDERVLAAMRGGARHAGPMLDALARLGELDESPAPVRAGSERDPRAGRPRAEAESMVWVGSSGIEPPAWLPRSARRVLADDPSDVAPMHGDRSAPARSAWSRARGEWLNIHAGRRLVLRLFKPRAGGAG